MPKSSEQKHGTPTQESPEWTEERLRSSLSFSQLPAEVQAATRRRGKRGPQKSPTKKLISIRLSADVLTALRAHGRGWQSLADEALRENFVKSK